MARPGDEYIAQMMRSRVSGLASTALANSPATSARSTLFASSSGTFSAEPLLLRGSMRSLDSCAFTISAKASPYTGKPPPGVAVARTRAKITSISKNRDSPQKQGQSLFFSLRLDAGARDDLLVEVHLAAHELGEVVGLHRRGLDAELL